MDRRQFLAVAGASLAAPVAGCTAPGDATATPAPQRVTVNFANESDRTVVFTAAAVAAGLGGVELEYADGGTETFPDAEAVDDVPAASWERAVTFTPLGESQRRQFRSTGGSGIGIEFEPMPYDTTVVTALAEPSADPPMRGTGAGSCGDAEEAAFVVAVDAEGVVHQSTDCTDTGPP